MCIHTHSRYPCRSVICESLSFFIFLFERYLYAIMSANSRQYILEMNIFFNKLPLLYRIHLCYTVREMNDMQNRIICVKCSANGSCRRNEKSVLRYMIRTRCNNIRGYLILCRDTFFDIRSITIGDIFFTLTHYQLDKKKTISTVHDIMFNRRLFF